MIEFNGLKIDTRSLVLIAVTIIAVVALWPDGESESDHKGVDNDNKPPAAQFSGQQRPAKQGLSAQTERQAPWQEPFNPYQRQPYVNADGYPRPGSSPQRGGYSQPPAYGNQRFRPPYEAQQQAAGQRPPQAYGSQGNAPYGGYSPYPGVRFRPKDQPQSNVQRHSGGGIPPPGPYVPASPNDSLQPAYSPVEPMPWEYSPPYETSPYDVAPSGSTEELNRLYTVR